MNSNDITRGVGLWLFLIGMIMVGMILGVLFFPPLGIILGPFIGAFVGELIYNRKAKDALKIASLAFISFLITTGLKFIYSIITIFILIKSVIESTFMS